MDNAVLSASWNNISAMASRHVHLIGRVLGLFVSGLRLCVISGSGSVVWDVASWLLHMPSILMQDLPIRVVMYHVW